MTETNHMQEYDTDLAQLGVCQLWGEITTESALDVSRFILSHNHKPRKGIKHLTLVINSEGGDLINAFALIDLMQHSKVPVHTLGIGQISSAGLMVFMAGTKGHRVITANTHVMSHQWSGSVEGKAHELLSAQQDMMITQARVLRHYCKHSGQTEQVIKDRLLPPHDVYLTADEAVQLGVADRIQA